MDPCPGATFSSPPSICFGFGHPVSDALAHALQDKRDEIRAERTMKLTWTNPKTNDVWEAGDVIQRVGLAKNL